MLCPEDLAASVTAAAITISKCLDEASMSLLAAALTQLGDTLATIAEARSRLEAICPKEENHR